MSKTVSEVKSELLKKYVERPPTAFLQMDGFLIGKNPEDDEIFSGNTFELMHSSDVRVLVKAGTTHAQTVRLLKRIVECMEKN